MNPRVRGGGKGAFVAALALGLSSCTLLFAPEPRPVPVNNWKAGKRSLRTIRRVLVLPVTGESLSPRLRRDFTRILLGELSSVGRFQVLGLPEESEDWKVLVPTAIKGRLSTKKLVELGRRYQVDGLLLVRIISWRPYRPPIMGIQSELVSVHTGAVLWAADATYDASAMNIRLDLRDYYERVLAPTQDLHGYEFLELSPRAYARYVLHRLSGTLR